MSENAILIGLIILLGVVVGSLAARKNRNPIGWGLFGAIGTVPALVAIAFMSFLCPKCKGPITNKERREGTCPRCDAEDQLDPTLGASSRQRARGAEDDEGPSLTYEQITERLRNQASRWEKEGANLAEDCLTNGLRKNQIVKLSDMERLIRENFDYDPDSVSTGFMVRMTRFIDSGEIVSLSVDGGDSVFVHKDYASTFLSQINRSTRG